MSTCTEILPLTETISPADEAAVAAVVRSARGDGAAIYPIGGAAGLDYGVRPSRPGIGLSLKNLDRVIDYPADDLTITVEAGLTVADLNQRLAAKRQRLPLDVSQPARATIGGVVASDFSGPRRYAHGTIRDYVIGIRAVDGRGTAFSGGGRVVKNAAGYDLCRMLVGSLGTLGVITQVTLMVRPMPESSAWLVCDLPDLDAAEGLLAAVIHSKTLPTAVELLAGPARQDNPVLGPMLEGNLARLFVGFEGSRDEVDWMVGQLGEEWGSLGVASPMTVSGEQAGRVWDWLGEFPAHAEINVLPGATADTIERMLLLDPDCSIQAHAGNGVIRARFSSPGPDRFGQFIDRCLRPEVTAAGGHVVVLSCADDTQLTGREIWGPPGDAAAVMQALKDRFDPDGLFNPGRFAY